MPSVVHVLDQFKESLTLCLLLCRVELRVRKIKGDRASLELLLQNFRTFSHCRLTKGWETREGVVLRRRFFRRGFWARCLLQVGRGIRGGRFAARRLLVPDLTFYALDQLHLSETRGVCDPLRHQQKRASPSRKGYN